MMKGAGPFKFEGKNVGVLMLHGGGGGTAADLNPIARKLNKKTNYYINVPLLPGFGTTPEDLRKITVQEWKNHIHREMNLIDNRFNKVFIGGHSMGGVLSFIVGSKRDVTGIFSISAATGLNGIGFKLIPIVKLFKKYIKVNSEALKADTDGKWVGYNKIPVNIGPKVKMVIKEMKHSLSNITCPVLLFQGKHDSIIKKESMDRIYNSIKSSNKKKIWLENNDHSILGSPDQDIIVRKINEFISNNS